MRNYIYWLLLLAFFAPLSGSEHQLIHNFSLGPELSHVKRTREGGTRQTGTLLSIKGEYERIKRYGWYIGLEGAYGSCNLWGKTGDKNPLKSRFSNSLIEARAGYTFQTKCRGNLRFTPFIGTGYLLEKNHFKPPSELRVHFRNSVSFVSGGFFLDMYLTENLKAGFNCKIRFPWRYRFNISHDPSNDRIKLAYEERKLVRLEWPISYDMKLSCFQTRISLIPFVEIREYGTLAGYPFDFLKTKLTFAGASLEASLIF